MHCLIKIIAMADQNDFNGISTLPYKFAKMIDCPTATAWIFIDTIIS